MFKVPRWSDDVGIESDVIGGKLFGCDNDGNPIIILLFDTDDGTLVIPFKLFSVESKLKPLFPLLWCGLSKPKETFWFNSSSLFQLIPSSNRSMMDLRTYILIGIVQEKPTIVRLDRRNLTTYSRPTYRLLNSLAASLDSRVAIRGFCLLKTQSKSYSSANG